MKIKILVLLNIVILGIAAYLFFRTRSYEQEIEFENERFQSVTDSLQYYRYVSMGDSLMIAEDFDGAMEYFRKADNMFEHKNLVEEMKSVAEGVRSKSESIAQLRARVVRMQHAMEKEKDSLQKELQIKDSLMGISLGNVRLQAYRNEILRDSLSHAKGAIKEIESRAASVGKAEFQAPTGVKVYYAGELSGGKASGHGYGLFATGGIYEGEWKDNQRHGEGKYIWKDGNVYIGEYQDDKRAGTGTYYFSSGEKYVGQWKDNKRSGQGTLFGSEGEVMLSGQWKDDQIVQVESKGGYQQPR